MVKFKVMLMIRIKDNECVLQLAAKIQPSGSSSSETAQKRILEDSLSGEFAYTSIIAVILDDVYENSAFIFLGEPETKKQAILPPSVPINNSNRSPSINSTAAQVAAAQAAALTARVAAAAASGIQGVGSNLLGPTSNKDIKVPDKMVGLSEYCFFHLSYYFADRFRDLFILQSLDVAESKLQGYKLNPVVKFKWLPIAEACPIEFVLLPEMLRV